MRCRYLVDISWFKQWKKFVGFDSWDMFGVGDPSLFPGPVDNSGLFSGEWCRGDRGCAGRARPGPSAGGRALRNGPGPRHAHGWLSGLR